MVATVLPDWNAEDWAYSLLSTVPKRWASAEQRQPGGELYAIAKMFGVGFEHINDSLIYAFNASRIETATDDALDAVAADFFGAVAGYPDDIVRVAGESDDHFRARIKAALFPDAVTRQAFSDLLLKLVGERPRLLEPWRCADNAVMGRWFVGIDTLENPSRIGNSALRNSAFIESRLPSYTGKGSDVALWGVGAGFCVGTPSGYVFTPDPGWWLTTGMIDAMIRKIKVFGTDVWRRYQNPPIKNYAIGAAMLVPDGAEELVIDVMPPFGGNYMVLAATSWDSGCNWSAISNAQFKLFFESAAPAGGMVCYMAAPVTMPGSIASPVPTGATFATVSSVSHYSGKTLIVKPSWNTNYWLATSIETEAIVNFSSAAPESAKLSCFYFDAEKSGVATVQANSTSVLLETARISTQLFVLPTWETTCILNKQDLITEVIFGTAPLVDSPLYWGTNP